MAKMSVLYKINPSEPGRDAAEELLNSLREKLKKLSVDIQDYKIEPLAFNLYSLTILIVIDEGNMEILNKIEDVFRNDPLVNSFENVGMSRL